MSEQDGFQIWHDDLCHRLSPQQHLSMPPTSAAAQAFAAIAMLQATNRPVLWIVADEMALTRALRDLHALQPAQVTQHLAFPPIYPQNHDRKHPDLDGTGTRLQTLYRIAELLQAGQAPLLIAPLAAVAQPTIKPTQMFSRVCRIAVATPITMDHVRTFLVQTGYNLEGEVLEKGQCAARGGILDIWPPDTTCPLRLEWFGNEVESIRFFDPITQRTIEKTAAILLSPLTQPQDTGATILDHVPTLAAILWFDHQSAREALQEMQTGANLDVPIGLCQPRGDVITLDFGSMLPDQGLPVFAELDHAVHLPASSGTAQLEDARQHLIKALVAYRKRGWTIRCYFDTLGTRDHFRHHLMPDHVAPFQTQIGCLSQGFLCPTIQYVFVAESDLYGRKRFPAQTDSIARKTHRHAGSRINDFTDMEVGDLVVHVDHGVGRYRGVQKISFNHKLEEVLAIDYADDAKLYVPIAHAHLLSRYVGMAGSTAGLHRLGGKRWAREKAAAKTAVIDLAAELLEIQARRNLLEGHAFLPDGPLQHEFDQAFPFVETLDQIQVIAEVKADMQATRPMDRLICGDAGYGKTEVAMRAAFKAVTEKIQVAVLVPTTVLAQQHFQTFSERMAGFDIRIAVISRFQTIAQRKRTLQALRHGTVDIIIGTHALVQDGVRFANLGLVIIDEEQRFGVAHKERLKSLRALVDVLTLSATPIPRTLYMSMTGARDLSLLRTAPRERVPIETIVATATDKSIADAIRYEYRRGGQVYFLHNRVVSIATLREKLAALVPEVRLEMAHGRMQAAELSAVMQRFANGHIDVLLCTTIIESGLDIPRANTMIIDRADRFGIADLYQLRGRVGRGDRKGYAYLMLPRHGIIDKAARERIQAIQRHTGLGAGFNLALKDMEIRGAGNILGAAQSGHISAVGFSLYCQLLQRAVARMQGLPVPELETEIRLDFIATTETTLAHDNAPAGIPRDYITDERLRIASYRKMAEAPSPEALQDLQAELVDRFGPLPVSVNRLLAVARIRCMAAQHGLTLVEARQSRVLLFKGDHAVADKFPRLRRTDPDQKLQEVEDIIQTICHT